MDHTEKVRTQNRTSADAWHAIADAVAPADTGIADRARRIAASLDLPLPPKPALNAGEIAMHCPACRLTLTGPKASVTDDFAEHLTHNPVLGMSQCQERQEIAAERAARQSRTAETVTVAAARAMGMVA